MTFFINRHLNTIKYPAQNLFDKVLDARDAPPIALPVSDNGDIDQNTDSDVTPNVRLQ